MDGRITSWLILIVWLMTFFLTSIMAKSGISLTSPSRLFSTISLCHKKELLHASYLPFAYWQWDISIVEKNLFAISDIASNINTWDEIGMFQLNRHFIIWTQLYISLVAIVGSAFWVLWYIECRDTRINCQILYASKHR